MNELKMQERYLLNFLAHFKDGNNLVLDIDGSILSLKQARSRLDSFISIAGSAEQLVFMMQIEGDTQNAKLANLLELIRSCRAMEKSASNPQVKAYWNLKAEIVTIIHGYYRDQVYP